MARIARPTGLPDFTRPPVTEVVLSIQFATLEKFRSAHVGHFWKQFRSKYPNLSEQAILRPVFETFGTAGRTPPAVRFEEFLSPPMPRYWFDEEGKPDLLQLQQDRIVHNWRKSDQHPNYPRYERIR